MTEPALSLAGIRKQFGAVTALDGADFELRPGELHALLGENGAGKSTLMHIAYGLVRPDAGVVRVSGRPARLRSPRDARALGIGMVHQHATSVPSFTVAENVALAAGWAVRPAELARHVGEFSGEAGLPLDPETYAGRLSVGMKQRLEIVKALAADARILLLDEPTAVLAPAEAEELLTRIRAFTRRGGSAVLITHRLREALAHADRITVLRRGRVTWAGRPGEADERALASAMVGAEAAALVTPPQRRDRHDDQAPVLLRADDLEVQRDGGFGLAVRQVTLSLRAGEIVGLAAVEGNGQRELLRALAGVMPSLRGRLGVEGEVSFIPQDRTTEGLIPSLSLTENLVLGLLGRKPWSVRGRVAWRAARQRTAELIEAFGIRASGPGAAAAQLSGGNQQKVVVARALERRPAVIVAEDPTRGLDVAAAHAVLTRLRAAADSGAAVIMHSSDLDEVLAADRVFVMHAGRVTPAPQGATRELVGRLMLGLDATAGAA